MGVVGSKSAVSGASALTTALIPNGVSGRATSHGRALAKTVLGEAGGSMGLRFSPSMQPGYENGRSLGPPAGTTALRPRGAPMRLERFIAERGCFRLEHRAAGDVLLRTSGMTSNGNTGAKSASSARCVASGWARCACDNSSNRLRPAAVAFLPIPAASFAAGLGNSAATVNGISKGDYGSKSE